MVGLREVLGVDVARTLPLLLCKVHFTQCAIEFAQEAETKAGEVAIRKVDCEHLLSFRSCFSGFSKLHMSWYTRASVTLEQASK